MAKSHYYFAFLQFLCCGKIRAKHYGEKMNVKAEDGGGGASSAENFFKSPVVNEEHNNLEDLNKEKGVAIIRLQYSYQFSSNMSYMMCQTECRSS